MNLLFLRCTEKEKPMPNHRLINKSYFIAALSSLLSGYTAMAVINLPLIQMSIAPLLIVLGFVLVVLSIMIPAKV